MKISLRVSILSAISSLIVVSSIVIISFSIVMGRNSVENVLASLTENVSKSVMEKTVAYLEPAATLARLMAIEHKMGSLSRLDAAGDNEREDAERMTRSMQRGFNDDMLAKYGLSREEVKTVLAEKLVAHQRILTFMAKSLVLYPQIPKIHITDYMTRDFFMVKKMDDGTISTTCRVRYRTSSGEEVTITGWDHTTPAYYNENYIDRLTKRKTDYSCNVLPEKVAYRPEKRPWFTAAVEEFSASVAEKREPGASWTKAYVFFSDQTTGLSCSIPLVTDGTIASIFCVDIGLIDLSTQYLAGLKIGKSGRSYILNEEGAIIAYAPETSKADDAADEIKTLITENPVIESGKVTGYNFELTNIESCRHELYRNAFLASGIEPKTNEAGARSLSINSFIRYRFVHHGTPYLGLLTPFPENRSWKWNVGIVVPEDDFMAIVKQNTMVVVLVSLAAIALSLVVGGLITAAINRKLTELVLETEKVRQFDLDASTRVTSFFSEIETMGEAFYTMALGLKSFGKYIPSDVVRYLVQSGKEANLGGEHKVLTVLFSDIMDFTTISESLSPNDLVIALGEYMNEMSAVITAHGGTIDKYNGDAIMAFWGAPRNMEDHALRACIAAVEYQKRLAELRKGAWKDRNLPPFTARIGINTGDLVLGNMGSPNRLNYTVIGDTVNLASRLEGINKVYGTSIIIGERTHAIVKDTIPTRILDVVAVKGKCEPVAIYEVLGLPEDVSAMMRICAEIYAEGFDHYRARRFERARTLFNECLLKRPDDTAAKLLVSRCTELLAAPPAESWNGVYVLDEK